MPWVAFGLCDPSSPGFLLTVGCKDVDVQLVIEQSTDAFFDKTIASLLNRSLNDRVLNPKSYRRNATHMILFRKLSFSCTSAVGLFIEMQLEFC